MRELLRQKILDLLKEDPEKASRVLKLMMQSVLSQSREEKDKLNAEIMSLLSNNISSINFDMHILKTMNAIENNNIYYSQEMMDDLLKHKARLENCIRLYEMQKNTEDPRERIKNIVSRIDAELNSITDKMEHGLISKEEYQRRVDIILDIRNKVE